MHVRQAAMDDAALLAELNSDVQRLHAAALPHIYKPVKDLAPVIEDFRNRILAGPDWHTFVGEVEGEAVGYVCARIMKQPEHAYGYAREYVHVDQISVRPAYQGRGYGQALMQAIFDLARSEGVRRVRLDTLAFNTQALAFYTHLGFDIFKYTMAIELEDERHREAV